MPAIMDARVMRLITGPVTLAFILLLLFDAQSIRAVPMDAYDLDALVYTSSDIVEATLMRSNYIKGGTFISDIKVTAVYKGKFKPGELVAVCMSDYQVTDEKTLSSWRPLSVGDTFFFFLTKVGEGMPKDAYCPEHSGLKLIRNNKVIPFAQEMNPGGYIAQLPGGSLGTKESYPTPAEYRKQIQAGIVKMDALAARLKQPAATVDIPWLIQVLRERAQTQAHIWMIRDEIAKAVSSKLANLHDPESLFEAIFLKGLAHWPQSILVKGLGTPAGREALLKRLGDDRMPLETRITCARFLKDLGAIYHQTFTNIVNYQNAVIGGPQGKNEEYLTRIARLGLENRQKEEFCLALLDSLDSLFCTVNQTKDKAVLADRDTALPVLKTLHDSTKSEQVKFQVEVTIRHASREAYDRFSFPGGPVISQVAIPGQKKDNGQMVHSLDFDYVIYVLDKQASAPSLVFMNLDTGKFWSVPSEISFHDQGRTSGSRSIVLPKDLPHGRYLICLQYTRDRKKISTGHAVKADL
jgi:hypothetical protein